MPTPLSVARQCLAEDASSALDDALAVAKRRSHAQTTSLHAVSALIALPSSSLREACTRGRTSAYSPRLQFRALELCVGVALDRISACKSTGGDPPVSNSLMAAIKRSQANQRRDPETFHLYQQLNSNSSSPPSISVVKVELKHFMMSILDDPIVSRVFGDAGFLTNDLKLAIINPLAMLRFSPISRCPPLFSCGLSDSELSARGPYFPFKTCAESVDENLKRIGEILVKPNNRNPLLIGVCAKDAFRNFIESLKSSKSGILPNEIDGLSLISIDHELSMFLHQGSSEKILQLKFNEVRDMSEKCHGPGVIVNCGDLKPLVDVESTDIVICMVSHLKRLLNSSKGKLWLIVFLSGDGEYKKLLQRFPSIEMDLDLHLLPITSSKPSVGGKYFKSNLMGSFVPFAGFFSMPFEHEIQGSNATQSSSLCTLCIQKYEQEVTVLRGTSTDSVDDNYSTTLSSWLRMNECITSKRFDTVKAQDDKTVFDFRVTALRMKWSDICQRLHHHCTTQESVSETKLHTISGPSFHDRPILKDSFPVGSLSYASKITNTSPVTPSGLSRHAAPKPECSKPSVSKTAANVQLELSVQALKANHFQEPSCYQQQKCLPSACTYSSSVNSVTTDLGLGTLYASDKEVSRKPNLQEPYLGLHNLTKLSRTHENIRNQVSDSSLCSHKLERHMYAKDLEYPWKLLAKKVYWQIEAIESISQTLFCCLNGDVRYRCPKKGNHWLSFLGPDKVGKRKIAATLAEIFFGGREHLLSLDLSSLDMISPSNSIFDHYDSAFPNVQSRRKMIVDFLAEELSKRPHSVVLLENIEKADFLVQNSLSLAVKTGKFPDSHGRDISINNIIFVITSKFLKGGENLLFDEATSEFSEENILEARNLQMEILIGSGGGDFSNNSTANISVTPINGNSNICPMSKRKLRNHDFTRSSGSKRTCQSSRSIIDLNLPVESMEEDIDTQGINEDDCDSANSEVWLEELLGNFDENVPFKPYAFNSLVKKILKEIDVSLQRVVGAKILLEIDREVMNQILAAAWLADRKNALDDWIEQVLCSSIKEALQRYNASSDFIFRLAACNGLDVKDQASGVCLPARINVK